MTTMYAIHFRISGSWMYQAVLMVLAPSQRAASMTSSEMLFNAPYMMMIHPPAPVQNATTVKIRGRLFRSMAWTKFVYPNHLRTKDTGLTEGLSTKSQSMTLAEPANAPGM